MKTLKRFIHYYAPYRAIFFLDLLCATVISAIDLAYPQILRTLTNTLFTKNGATILHALGPIAIGLFLMYVLQSLCKYYVSCQGHMMGARMERDMRQQLFNQYERLSFSYYDQHNSGQMMSRLVSDLFDISEFAHHGPENLFISIVKIVGSFVFLFLINWRLAIPLAILVVCMFLFSLKQNRRMQQTFLENRRKIGDVNASLQDTLAGIRVVQSFANEDIERQKFYKSNHDFLQSKDDNYRCMGSFMSWNLFFQGMMYLTTLVFGGFLISKGLMNVGDLAMYALYIGIFISPIQILVELTEMMQKDCPDSAAFFMSWTRNRKSKIHLMPRRLLMFRDMSLMKMYLSITVMMTHRFYLMYPSGLKPGNQSHWWDLPAAGKLLSVRSFLVFTM